jgi:predicted AlkP superfamily pyrophosphatase or phosphodiesterase
MQSKFRSALLFLFAVQVVSAQQTPFQPKLVVGIVVDQMRYDYLYRYRDSYGPGGFKRLLGEGFSCENAHYNYMPTYTGPGHAAIYTGATPSVNGVIANEWWDPEWHEHRYVTTDKRYQTIGAPDGKSGRHSPAVLLSTTITDELKLSNNFRSKVVGICLKDRGSILPAGHFPDGCYWFDDPTGNWITSTYYPDSVQLAPWVKTFNDRKLPDAYMSKPWVPLKKPVAQFFGWEKFKSASYGKIAGGFPYDLAALKKNGYGDLRFTPFGNSLTMDFALEAITTLQLGADAIPDFLCVSFSSTDYCGHQFGIHAEETEDTYIRLDQDIERLLTMLDKTIGKENVLVFLTADHGGAETPAHLNSLRVPAGVFSESKIEDVLEKAIAAELALSGDFIHEVSNQQVWLNWEAMTDLETEPHQIADIIVETLRRQPGVYDAFTREEAMMLPPEYPFIAEIRRGLHPRRSGDLLFLLDAGWHPDDALFKTGGTTHGSQYAYDTHVPLLWYGWRIPRGEGHSPVSITDIAPTLAAMLKIMEPSGNTGKVIEGLFRR